MNLWKEEKKVKCKECGNELYVESGGTERIESKIYWKQIFKCKNPNCKENGQVARERLTNVEDENELIER